MSLLLDRAYCINLDGQRDRWWEIEPKLEEWNRNERLPEVQRFPGVDEEAPPDWERGAALWGCFEAHRRLLGSMRGITRGVLILEDDADIKPGFAGEVVDILRE